MKKKVRAKKFRHRDFGEHLAALRKNTRIKGEILKQKELADMLELSVHQIRKYEWGENLPSVLTLRKLCKIFDVSSDTIMARAKHPVQQNYDRLGEMHKKIIEANIRMLLETEDKDWEEKNEKKN